MAEFRYPTNGKPMLRSLRLGSDVEIFQASPRLSLDNGAMVARAGRFRLERGEVGGAELEADARLPFPGMTRRSAT